jgi:hypothetical protein
MVATPLAQVGAVAVATYCTGELTVAPFAGLVTFTEAKADAGVINRARTEKQKVFITLTFGNRYLGPGVGDSEVLPAGAARLRASVSGATDSKGGWEAVGTQKDFSVVRNHQCYFPTFFGSNVGGLIFPEEEPIVNWFFALSPVDISRKKLHSFECIRDLRDPAGRGEKIRQ